MKSVSILEVRETTDKEVEKLKLEKLVYEESGTNPVIVSVVLPTFNNGAKDYYETLKMILKEIGSLIDAGAIDELVIADGSRDKDGNPDYDFIRFMLALCVKHCKTFSDEVKFVTSMPDVKQRSMQGRFDFSVRFLSQLDPLLHKIFLDRGVLTESEVEFLKKGKGAGLWYSVPVTYGHIICFVDSDIRSFKQFYVTSLCRPILDTWHADQKTREISPGIVFTKAVYTRKTETEDGPMLGGRLARICAAPLFRTLAKMGKFEGLEEIEYHTSGECAFSLNALKTIQFTNGYDIETSVLCQVWKNFGMDKVAQVDLGLYQHIPGSEEHVEEMMKEFVTSLRYWSEKYGIEIDIGRLARDYEREGYKMVEEQAVRAAGIEGIGYSGKGSEMDKKRLKTFLGILKEYWRKSGTPKLLKPWSLVESDTNLDPEYSYQSLKLSLRKRINKLTSGMILSSIYIDKSDDIIQKYTGVHRP